MNESTSTLYQHVLRGLAEECSQVEALDRTFVTFVTDVRHIEQDALGGLLSDDRHREWDRIASLLTEIHGHAVNTRARLEHPVETGSDPLAEWQPVAAIEDEVEGLLAKRKADSAEHVPEGKRAVWEAGWAALESSFSTLRAHARSLQVKLELQRRFGKEKAAEVAAELVEKLPEDLRDPEGLEAFEKADKQLQEDRDHIHGVWDMVKAMLLWVETPEERARKIRAEK